MTEKKTVEQLRAEYEALATEVSDIQVRLVALQPALAEHERLESRLSQITGPGRNLITSARVALKEALFKREMGGTDKPVICQPEDMIGVSAMHTNCAGEVDGNALMAKFAAAERHLTPEGSGGGGYTTRGHGQTLVIDETGKGYWR